MAWSDEEMRIAEWMLGEFTKYQRLSQSTAARGIRMNYGEAHVYKNKQRNWGINKGILEAFKKLTPEGVVWSRSSQTWRARRATDPEGSRMVPLSLTRHSSSFALLTGTGVPPAP